MAHKNGDTFGRVKYIQTNHAVQQWPQNSIESVINMKSLTINKSIN